MFLELNWLFGCFPCATWQHFPHNGDHIFFFSVGSLRTIPYEKHPFLCNLVLFISWSWLTQGNIILNHSFCKEKENWCTPLSLGTWIHYFSQGWHPMKLQCFRNFWKIAQWMHVLSRLFIIRSPQLFVVQFQNLQLMIPLCKFSSIILYIYI